MAASIMNTSEAHALSGSGTEEEPYEIWNADDWEDFTGEVRSGASAGRYYKFMVIAIDGYDDIVSSSKIVHVATKGVITAKAAGSCKVYAYAQDGAVKAVTVTVQ